MPKRESQTTTDFERGKRYGRKEALNLVMEKQRSYGKNKKVWDSIGEIASALRFLVRQP